MGDYLYVCGGFDGTSSLNTVERYDPADDCWTEVASMTKFRSAAGTIMAIMCAQCHIRINRGRQTFFSTVAKPV